MSEGGYLARPLAGRRVALPAAGSYVAHVLDERQPGILGRYEAALTHVCARMRIHENRL